MAPKSSSCCVNIEINFVMSAKKKITQDELRKLMEAKKKKLTVGNKKIESPLAKYPFTAKHEVK